MAMDRVKKILLGMPFLVSVGLVVLYTLAGFFLVPFLVRHYVPRIAQEQLHKQAAIGDVRFNPYVFTFEANDFRLQEPDGQPILGFRRLFVDFELKSLVERAWTFRQVGLEGPHLNAVISKSGGLNLAALVPPSKEPRPPQEKSEGPPPLVVEELFIDQGQIEFSDQRPSKPASLALKPLQVSVKNLTTLLGQEGRNTITADLSEGGTLRWTGTIGLNPVVSRGSLAIENIHAATAWKFVRDAVNLEPPTGTFGLKADYGADLKGEDPQVTLADASVALSGLALKLHGAAAPFMELQDARIDGIGFDLARQQVDIGKVALHGGRARLAVDEGGTMNLERIAKAAGKPAASRPAPDPHVRPWKVKLNALELEKFALDFKNLSRTPGLKAAVGDLKVRLTAEAEAGDQARMRLSGLDVGLADLQVGFAEAAEPTLRASKAELQGGAYDLTDNLFTAEKAAAAGGSVDVRRQPDGVLNLMLLFAPPDKGTIVEAIQEAAAEAAAAGHPFRFLVKTAALADFRAALTDEMVKSDGPLLNLDEISAVLSNVDGKSPMTFEAGVQVREGGRMKAAGRIDPSGPAVEAEIQVAELGLVPFQPYLAQAAAVDLKSGAFSTKGNLRHGIKAAGAQTAYRGGFSVDNLRITEAGGKETLVGWSTVQTEQLALQIEPNGLEIGDLRVSQLGGKFIIEKDRSLNFTRVIKSDPAAKKAEKPQAAADPFPYRVRRVLVSGGLVNFADLSLLTPFGTKIHELKGIVAGVSSTRGARAQVKLDGRVDEYGTANIDGELNTSDPKAFTHISVVFRNVEMSRLTPYSGKFAGRKINSGKLSVDLKYKIDKSRLAGDNRIVVERLALGDKVESPVAVNLPLDLAVALLEDTNGLIDLGLPVSGNLDSPEFSFGALIWKAFANLITKIVTSPFRALGALLPGGGDETSNSVAFEPGRPDVPPPEKEKLARLADALQKRPQIRLSVQGRFNPQSDLAELRILNLSRNLTARLGQKPVPGEDPGPVDFSSPETGKALEALFAQRFGADALQALKAELKAADEKEKKDAAAQGAAAADAGSDDPGRNAKIMFDRLAAVEPVDDGALTRLADARAQAVVAELGAAGRIPAERIAIKPSAAMDVKDPVSALLDLEAGR
ncbi:MAG: DUF748 domain-containing protein [Desulfobacterales bacterium]|jgi:hypothetical protein|nr:DUF748 domain-containing protein [Desulfobacterales bacterium]